MSDVIIHHNKDYHFDLALKEDGKKAWHIEDTPILPPMFTSDRPLYARVPPEKEEFIEQDFFYAGMGEGDFAHGYRYHNSPGADARRKGAVVCGPRIVQSTITIGTPGNPTPTYPGFETDGWMSGNVDVVGTPDYDDFATTGTPRTDTHHASINMAPFEVGYMYQNIASYADYKGKIVTFTAYAKVSSGVAPTLAKIGIDDGKTIAYSSTTNSDSYVLKTVTTLISPSATRLRFILYGDNSAEDASTFLTYFDDTAATVDNGTKGAIVAFCEYGGSLYAADGDILLKWDGTDWDVAGTFAHTITDLCVWGNYLFIGQGTAYKYWYFDGTSFTESTISDGQIRFFALVGSTLWGNQSTYQVSSSTNPLNGGSWATETTIINSSKIITGLLSHPDTVLVATQDGLWEVTTTAVDEEIPDLAQEADTYTGVNFDRWRGNIYFPTGLHALYEYDITNAIVTSLTPAISIPGQADFIGRVLAMDGNSNYLFVVLDNGTEVEILAGHWEAIGALTGWWWHQIAELTLTNADKNVRACIISALGSTKLFWLGCSSTTDGIYYLYHPRFYGDVTEDTEYQMNKSGYLVTSWLLGSYVHDKKTFYSLTVRNKSCSTDLPITVEYNLEGETGWTSLGTIDAAPSETLYFNSNVTSTKIQFKFTLTSNAYTTTPQLLGYTLRCVSRPFNLEEGRITINPYGEFRMFGGAETSWKHTEYSDSQKNFYSITVLSENLSTTNYLTLQYKLDDEALYTIHDSIIIDTSPNQTVYLPVETVGKLIYVKFTPATTTGDLIAYIIDGVIRPPKRKLLQFSVYLSSLHPHPTGGIIKDSVAKKVDLLRELDEKKWPVTVTFDGTSYDVVFDNLVEDLFIDSPTKQKEWIFTIKAIEAKLKEE